MTRYCVDTSAWHRSTNPAVAHRWRALLESDSIGLCDQVRLEILYSARSSSDYESLAIELGGLHPIPMDHSTWERALEVQHQLALVGGLHHRSVNIADLLIAASAEHAATVVLHHDHDFDRIARVTGQPTEWIVPPPNADTIP